MQAELNDKAVASKMDEQKLVGFVDINQKNLSIFVDASVAQMGPIVKTNFYLFMFFKSPWISHFFSHNFSLEMQLVLL